jgi:hypothetical protein
MTALPEPPLTDARRIARGAREARAPRLPPATARGGPGSLQLQALGVLLFLFIPAVLYLFVRHPEPVAWSLGLGIALMLGHRFLARPYMARALPRKCLWCNRVLPPALDASTRTLDLAIDGDLVVPARCCAAHRAPTASFFRFLDLARLPLRLGIFVPLLLLLAALAAAGAAGAGALPAAAAPPAAWALPIATALFQLLVGLTVSAAAWGYLVVAAPAEPKALPVPFPAHNFFLLGVRLLLWIFRLVGAWWIYRGAAFFLASR